MDNAPQAVGQEKNYVGKSELVMYIAGTSFLAMLTDMVANYRGDYLNNILMVSENNQKTINMVVTVVAYLISFFVTYFIDNFKGKRGKFRPIAMVSAVPFAVFGFLMFYTPFGEGNTNTLGCVIYLIAITVGYRIFSGLAHTANNVAIVITPNEKERNRIFPNKSLFNSITASTPLLIVMVLGILKKKGYFDDNMMYIIALAICTVLYLATIIPAMLKVQERLPFPDKKNNMFEGIKDVLKNKNFLWLTFSHQIRNFRLLGTSLGIYVAGALLGDTSKYIFFALPTGIGSVVGMLFVRTMLKKSDAVRVYVIFGILSLISNVLAFGSGLMYLLMGGLVWQVLFMVFLFAAGFQFASSTIIPNIFNADILNELELQTGGKRLEQTIGFTQGLIGTVTGVVTSFLGPFILLNPAMIHYIQGVGTQTQETSIKLIFFYTVFAGFFFCVSLIPLIGYKLNRAKREEITAKLAIQRAERSAAKNATNI